MTFLELQNAVISDRFSESKREEVKSWLNFRYARIWASEDWTFKLSTTVLSVPGGAQSISRGSIGDIISMSDSTGATGYYPIYAYRPEGFWERSVTTQAMPSAYTIIGNFIWFNAPLDIARSYQVVYRSRFVTLADDADVPLIPSEFHQMLVHAAASEGLKRENDPSWEGEEQEYQSALDDMKQEYLSESNFYSHYPTWP